jgi:hypothetical protein
MKIKLINSAEALYRAAGINLACELNRNSQRNGRRCKVNNELNRS